MAAVEALKGIHVLQDMLEDIGVVLQGFDQRMKDIVHDGHGIQSQFEKKIYVLHSANMTNSFWFLVQNKD